MADSMAACARGRAGASWAGEAGRSQYLAVLASPMYPDPAPLSARHPRARGRGISHLARRTEVGDLVAHGDRTAGEDVRAQAPAPRQSAQDAGLGERLQVPAGIAQATAGALDLAHAKA